MIVQLLASGAILREVIGAAELLAKDWHISCDVWSITSFSELAREARDIDRWNRLHPTEPQRLSYLRQCFVGAFPIVAATDYLCAYPQLIAPYVDAPFVALGTDGFGRSDTRQRLRGFFEVNRYHITVAALNALARNTTGTAMLAAQAIERYSLDTEAEAPWLR